MVRTLRELQVVLVDVAKPGAVSLSQQPNLMILIQPLEMDTNSSENQTPTV